jgi:translation initiation factor 1
MAKDSNKIAYREFGDEEPDADDTVELPPNQHKLKIEASRKGKGGKTVTIISGFQVSSDTLNSLTKVLKNQCGAGGAMKDNSIEIQGDHRQKLLEIVTKLGYKAKLSGG